MSMILLIQKVNQKLKNILDKILTKKYRESVYVKLVIFTGALLVCSFLFSSVYMMISNYIGGILNTIGRLCNYSIDLYSIIHNNIVNMLDSTLNPNPNKNGNVIVEKIVEKIPKIQIVPGNNNTNTPQHSSIPKWLSITILSLCGISVLGMYGIVTLKKYFTVVERIYNYIFPDFTMKEIEERVENWDNVSDDIIKKSKLINKQNMENIIKLQKKIFGDEGANNYSAENFGNLKTLAEAELPTWEFIDKFNAVQNHKNASISIGVNIKLSLMLHKIDYSILYNNKSLVYNDDILKRYYSFKSTHARCNIEEYEGYMKTLEENSVNLQNASNKLELSRKLLLEVTERFNSKLDISAANLDESGGIFNSKQIAIKLLEEAKCDENYNRELKEFEEIFYSELDSLRDKWMQYNGDNLREYNFTEERLADTFGFKQVKDVIISRQQDSLVNETLELENENFEIEKEINNPVDPINPLHLH